MIKGDKIKYRCWYMSFTFEEGIENAKQGVEIIEGIYLGRAGKGKYTDFTGSDYVVQTKRGIVGIGKEQVILD